MRYGVHILVAVGLLLGCGSTFEPKGPFEQRIVIYGVVSPSRPTTLIRAYSTYDPPDFDFSQQTEDTPITDAVVTIKIADSTYTLRDTTLLRPDPNRYTSPIMAYVGGPNSIAYGSSYELNISSPTAGTVSGFVVVPGHASVTIPNAHILNDPARNEGQSVLVTSRLANQTFGFLVRALIEFDYSSGGASVRGVREVPVKYRRFDDGIFSDPEYPAPTRRTTAASSQGGESMTFPVLNFAIEGSKIRQDHGGVVIRRVIFVVTQIEEGLYKYYNIANGYQDERSIRLDRPDYSNITNGIGVFGAFSEDSVFVTITGGI